MRTETPRPFGWWWQKFLQNVPHPSDATFSEFEEMYYDPCRGFMCWMVTARMKEIFITKCCGDGRYWRDKAFEMFKWAQEHYGVKYMIVCAYRNPEAYCRLFKCDLWKTEERHGKTLYWFRVKEAR